MGKSHAETENGGMNMEILACMGGVFAFAVLPVAALSDGKGKTVTVETSNKEKSYLAYEGKPLLAFGPGDENRMISRNDMDAVRRWAKWQQENGMNLLRAYPASVPIANGLHPFKMKDDKWDIDDWNDEYFENVSRFIEILEEHGIMLHLQLWQVCWFKEDRPERWLRNYINPANNCNEWTKEFVHGHQYMNAPGDSRASRHRKEWVTRVLNAVKGHGNVWIDVLNELGNDGMGDMKWSREVVSWIREWGKTNGQKMLIGVDMCDYSNTHFSPYEADYDLLIFNELHRSKNMAAVKDYNKPAVTVRSSDGTNQRADYLFLDVDSTSPEHQTRYRTLCYRSIFSGVQSIGAYWKREVSEADYKNMKDWPVYSKALRSFWNKISPHWPELAVDDSVVSGAVTPQAYGMKCDSLYTAYLECGSHTSDNKYDSSTVKIKCPFEQFDVELFEPRTGISRSAKGSKSGAEITVHLPAFTDDLVVLLWPSTDDK